MASTKKDLINLLIILNCEDRMSDVEAHVSKARELYISLPQPYPGDGLIYDFYKKGLSTGDVFDNVKKSCAGMLALDQSILISLASMGLHYHRYDTNINDGDPECSRCGGIGYAPTARSMDHERCHCNP